MSSDASVHAPSIRRLATVTEAQVQALAELLIDCVDGGSTPGSGGSVAV